MVSCRTVDEVLDEHMKHTVTLLRDDCKCREEQLGHFSACLYRHKNSLTRYGHNVLRHTNHEINNIQLVAILMDGTLEANRDRVTRLVYSLLRSIAMHTDSFET